MNLMNLLIKECVNFKETAVSFCDLILIDSLAHLIFSVGLELPVFDVYMVC
jgi:hypothetical protein